MRKMSVLYVSVWLFVALLTGSAQPPVTHYSSSLAAMENEYPTLPRQNHGEDDPKMIGLWKVGRTIGKGSSGIYVATKNMRFH